MVVYRVLLLSLSDSTLQNDFEAGYQNDDAVLKGNKESEGPFVVP